jgi:outer membrane protein assembly factor BamB
VTPRRARPSWRNGTSAAHPDPMAADRRVLTIGMIALVAFVMIGVVSASLFTASACRDLEPRVVTGLEAPATSIVPVEVVAGLVDALGPMTGVLVAGDAPGAAVTDDGPVLLGSRAMTIGGQTPQAVEIGGRVIGSGPTLFAVAWINDLTGQIDALRPMTSSLEPGACLDTAVVGEPFAFHLDARDGALLLLRVEEDAADPEIELRDEGGRRWRAPLATPIAPPGVLGERVSGLVADDVVVVTRRAGAGEAEPAVVALDLRDGTPRWTRDASGLGAVGDEPAWWRPEAVVDATVIVSRDRRTLVGLDVDDGTIRWERSLDGSLLAAGAVGGEVVVAVATATEVVVSQVAVVDGTAQPLGRLPASERAVVIGLDDAVLVGTSSGWLVAGADGGRATGNGPEILAGVHHDGATLLVVALDGVPFGILFGG